MINAIGAYTGDGVMFTVDTRLRPNGREGALVQPEGTYREYFAKHAEAWEGIAYMKSRAVAGNLERATEFLHGCRSWIGGATGRAAGRARNWRKCARAWRRSRGPVIR
jgi:glutamine synthetase adenylyltransferase